MTATMKAFIVVLILTLASCAMGQSPSGQTPEQVAYNLAKKQESKSAVDVAAAQMLFDSVASEAARLKQDMQNSQNEAVASKAKCQSDTNSLLAATVLHKRASATAKDTKTIDQELAVIQHLRHKLQELHDIKGVQTSNVQLDASDSVSRAFSDASANMRPSTSLELAQLMADAGTGRHFAESGAISRLLDQLVSKLNAERFQKRSDVSKTNTSVKTASIKKLKSCNAATASVAKLSAAAAAFNIVSQKLRARTDELNSLKAEAKISKRIAEAARLAVFKKSGNKNPKLSRSKVSKKSRSKVSKKSRSKVSKKSRSNPSNKSRSKVSKKSRSKVSKKSRSNPSNKSRSKVSKKSRSKVSKKSRSKVSKKSRSAKSKSTKRLRLSSSTALGKIIKRYGLEKYMRGIKLRANPRFTVVSSKVKKSGRKPSRRVSKAIRSHGTGRRRSVRRSFRSNSGSAGPRLLKQSGRKPSRRVSKATRSARAWIRRKFGGNMKRTASFLRRKFRGNSRAQKKWARRSFGANVSIRKALRRGTGLRRSVRRSSRSNSGSAGPSLLKKSVRKPSRRISKATPAWLRSKFGYKAGVRKSLRRETGRRVSVHKPYRRNVDFIAPNLRIIVEHSLKKTSQLARLCTQSEVNEMKGPKPRKCIVVFDLQQGLEIAKQAQVSEEELEDALEDLD